MIYLVDEKSKRQVDFGINKDTLSTFGDVLKPVHSIEELRNCTPDEFENPNNWFLFHDSFLTNLGNFESKKKQQLIDKTKLGVNLVLFGGSGTLSLRQSINNHFHKCSVHVLYRNLVYFLECASRKEFDIDNLFYGKDKDYNKIAKIRKEAFSQIFIREQNPCLIAHAQMENWEWTKNLISATHNVLEDREYSLLELKKITYSLNRIFNEPFIDR